MKTLTHSIDVPSCYYVGIDVHKKTISFCVFDPYRRKVMDQRQLPHDLPKVQKYLGQWLKQTHHLHCCYEASSCGFGLQRSLDALDGISCKVIAPSLIPSCYGDRIKTDSRDAEKLAGLHANGLLTSITVPEESHESHRSLLRCRGDLVEMMTTTKQRIHAFLQMHGFRYEKGKAWTKTHRVWLSSLSLSDTDHLTLHTYLNQLTQLEQEVERLEHELAKIAEQERYATQVKVLMAFRGISLITALTILFELGDLRRFPHPRDLMSFLGLVPSEHSSGGCTKRGGITKTGNVHVRKALVSCAWKYMKQPRCSPTLRKRQESVSGEVVSLSWKVQTRLYKRSKKLLQSKKRCVANVAIARELVGFIWAALHIENPLVTTRSKDG